MVRFPLSDKERAGYSADRRKTIFHASLMTVLAVLVWTWAFTTPNTGSWIAYVNAINCIVMLMSVLSMWKLVRKYSIRRDGRSFPIVTNVLGLIVFELPRKKGDDWKIIQSPSPSFFNIVGTLLEPTGRGPSMGDALHDLMTKVLPGFNGASEDKRKEYISKVNTDLEGQLNELIAARQSELETDGVE